MAEKVSMYLIYPDEQVDCSSFGVRLKEVTKDEESEPDSEDKDEGHDHDHGKSPGVTKIEGKRRKSSLDHGYHVRLILMQERKVPSPLSSMQDCFFLNSMKSFFQMFSIE